ncbi:hypothetical protein PO909_018878, partial [Leuciscus waleckii]
HTETHYRLLCAAQGSESPSTFRLTRRSRPPERSDKLIVLLVLLTPVLLFIRYFNYSLLRSEQLVTDTEART